MSATPSSMRSTARGLLTGLWIVALVSACTDRPTAADDDGSTSTTGTVPVTPATTTAPRPTDPTSQADTTAGMTSGPTSTSGSSSRGDDSSGNSFFGFDDFFLPFECDLWAQDCPQGDKCMPGAFDSDTWNGTSCQPIAPQPDGLGETCTVEGSAVSGIDSCGPRAMCWDVDPATLEGTCVPLCVGDESEPICEAAGTTCMITNQGAIVLCLPSCDPLNSSCAAAEACVPAGRQAFACVPQSPPVAEPGQPCEAANACITGTACVIPEATGCGAPDGCCAPLCNLDVGGCQDPMAQCVLWHAQVTAPPGLESVGLCTFDPTLPQSSWLAPNGWELLPNPGG